MIAIDSGSNRYRKGQPMQQSRTRLLFGLLALTLLLSDLASANSPTYVKISNWTKKSTITSCLQYTDAFPPFISAADHSKSSCTHEYDYMFATHTSAAHSNQPVLSAVSTLLVVSDWRNSLPLDLGDLDNRAQVYVCFTDLNPTDDWTNAWAQRRCVKTGHNYHSHVIDTSANPLWGAYIIIFTDCNGTCMQTTIRYLLTASEKIVPYDEVQTNDVDGNSAQYQKAVINSKFSVNCKDGYRVGFGCTAPMKDYDYNGQSAVMLKTVWLKFPNKPTISTVAVIPAYNQDGSTAEYFDETAANQVYIHGSSDGNLGTADLVGSNFKAEILVDAESWASQGFAAMNSKTVDSQITYMQQQYQSMTVLFKPYDTSKFILSGLVLFQTGAICQAEPDCSTKCIYFYGETSELTVTFTGKSTFVWEFIAASGCYSGLTFLAFNVHSGLDKNKLVSVAPQNYNAVTYKVANASSRVGFSWQIWDGGDITKARTQEFEFGVSVYQSDGTLIHSYSRKLKYYNYCDVDPQGRKNSISLPAGRYCVQNLSLFPGVVTDETFDMHDSFEDSASTIHSGADGAYCKAARQYVITPDTKQNGSAYQHPTNPLVFERQELEPALSSTLKYKLSQSQSAADSLAVTRVIASIVIGGETVCTVSERINYSLSCHVATVATLESGLVNDFQRQFGNGQVQFSWSIKYPTACVAQNEIVLETFIANDVGALVSIDKTSEDASIDGMSVAYYLFKVTDGGNAGKARTNNNILHGVQVKTAANQNLLVTFQRKLQFKNPCHNTNIFQNNWSSPLVKIQHQLGVYDLMEQNLSALTPDAVSASFNSQDHWTYCNTARVYEFDSMLGTNYQFTTLGFDPSRPHIFWSQIAAAQVHEFDESFTVTVKMVIEGVVIAQKNALAQISGKTCKMRSVTTSYPASHDIYLRQQSWTQAPAVWEWDPLCDIMDHRYIQFLKMDDTLIATYYFGHHTGLATGHNLPSGISVQEADRSYKIETRKEMVQFPHYFSSFKVQFKESWHNSKTTDRKAEQTSTTIINYLDKCGDPAMSSIQPFIVLNMETSVLRTISEYEGKVGQLHDLSQTIQGGDAEALFLKDDTARYRDLICGKMDVEVIHTAKSAEFFTFKYTFQDPANKLIEVKPTLNSHIGTHDIKLRIKYTDPDYKDVYNDVPIQVKILPCEIKRVDLESGAYTTPYKITILEQTKSLIEFATKKYDFFYNCDYPNVWSWSVTPSPGQNQDNNWYIAQSSTDKIGIQTENLWNRGTYRFTFTVRKQGYASQKGIGSYTNHFDVMLADPCENTKMTPSFNSTGLYAITGPETRTFTFNEYLDDVSEKYDPEDNPLKGMITCGPRVYEIKKIRALGGAKVYEATGKNTPNDYINVEKIDGKTEILVTYGSPEQSKGGALFSLEMHVHLSNYTIITHHQLTINLTLFNLDTDLKMHDKRYQLESDIVTVKIPEPSFTPPLHESNNEKTGANGADILYEVELVVDGKGLPLPEDLAVFDNPKKEISILSKEPSYIGIQQIKITYRFQDYLDGWQLSTGFDVYVQPAPSEDAISVQLKPFFDLADVSLSHNVTVGKEWKWTLPPYKHPDELATEVKFDKVELGKAKLFMEYTKETNELSIAPNITTEDQVGDYTIKLQLIDNFGIKSEQLSVSVSIVAAEAANDTASNSNVITQQVDQSIGLKYAQKLIERAKQTSVSIDGGEEEKIEYPTAKIDSIGSLGQVVVRFSKPMNVPDQLKAFAQGDSFGFRRLQNGQIKVDNIVEIDLLASDSSDPRYLGFEWKVEEFSNREMKIKLDFTQPLYISSTGERDKLEVKLKTSALLIDEDNLTLQEDVTLIKTIPKQFDNESTRKALQSTKAMLESGTQVTLIVNISLNFLQASSLQYLWDMINAQQIVILTPLFNVNIPQNAMIFFGWLMNIAAMEALPTDTIYDYVSKVEPMPIKQAFEDLGMEHHLLLNNYGTLGFVIAMIPLIYLIHWLIHKIQGVKCCRKFSKKLGKQLYWGMLLRLLIEGYVIGLICCLINVQRLDFSMEVKWTFVNTVLTLLALPIMVLFPILSVRFMVKNRRILNDPKMMQKYGEMTSGLNHSESGVILFWFMDYFRKGLLALVVVMTTYQLWLQMFVLFMLSVAMIISGGYVNARESNFDKGMDTFNEVKLILIMYHMMLFTNFVPDIETQYLIGFSCSGFLIIGTAVNMFMLFASPIVQLKRNCKIRDAKKAQRKQKALKRHAKGAKTFNERRFNMYKSQQERFQALMNDIDQQTKARIAFAERQQKMQELHDFNVDRKNQRREHMRNQMHEVAALWEVDQPEEIYIDMRSNDAATQEEQKVDYQQIDYIQSQLVEQQPPKKLLEAQRPSIYNMIGGTKDQSRSKPIAKKPRANPQKAKPEDVKKVQQDLKQRSSNKPGQKKAQPQRLTWDDLDHLWQNFGIGVSQIQTIPGYEDFEVTDQIPSELLSDIPEDLLSDFAQSRTKLDFDTMEEEKQHRNKYHVRDQYEAFSPQRETLFYREPQRMTSGTDMSNASYLMQNQKILLRSEKSTDIDSPMKPMMKLIGSDLRLAQRRSFPVVANKIMPQQSVTISAFDDYQAEEYPAFDRQLEARGKQAYGNSAYSGYDDSGNTRVQDQRNILDDFDEYMESGQSMPDIKNLLKQQVMEENRHMRYQN